MEEIKKQQDSGKQKASIRLWPGIVAAAILLVLRFGVPIVQPEAIELTVFGQLIMGLLIFIWWAFFSRVPRSQRWMAILLIVVAHIATRFLLHESVQKAGLGFLFPILAIPIMSFFFVVWAVLSHRLSETNKRISLIITVLLVCVGWMFVQTGGVDAYLNQDYSWRWEVTPEDQVLEQDSAGETTSSIAVLPEDGKPEWPGFRGALRDGKVYGVKFNTDWTTAPPKKLWQRPVGPGWSSFTVFGPVFYTQEQRGEEELVSCYKVDTGELVWAHRDEARFWESNGGAGPRGTPTLHNGRLYSLGGTGIVNVLDASTGELIWTRNGATDTETKVPIWGFSSSPLIFEDLVLVGVAGSLIAYDITSGEPRWSINEEKNECYSSPHLATIAGVEQVLFHNVAGIFSVTPSDGKVLWKHDWEGCPIVQPTLLPKDELLISIDDRAGMRRLAISQKGDDWEVEEKWTSTQIKPYFNDSALLDGYIYGFEGRSLVCIDVKDGSRKWKGGRYARGQFIMLADQALLLVISEKGKLALVKAQPTEFSELATVPGIKGKTWNHPVLVDDILLVRNAAEMAAFRI